MKRTRLQPGQVQFAQPFGDGALRHCDAETPSYLRTQIQAPPAHHLVDLGVRSGEHEIAQFTHLCRSQLRRRTWRLARCQTIKAMLVVANDPVTQGLPVHAGPQGSIKSGGSLQHHCDRQKPTGRRRVITLRRCPAKLRGQVIRAGNFDGCAHPILRAANRRVGCSESHFAPFENRGRVGVRGGWYYLFFALL
jgi:hypothetical protein